MNDNTLNPVIQQHWEGSWGTLLSGLEKILENDPRIKFEHALNILDKWAEKDVTFTELNNRITEQNGLPRDADGNPLLHLVAYAGKYKTVPRSVKHSHFVSNIIRNYISEETEVLVELGSGWGENLFRIYTRLKREKRFQNLKYVACELTNTGRQATKRLTRMIPKMNCEVYYLNYYSPDLSFINTQSNVLYFSSHSIEQVKNLPETIFKEMMRYSKKCSCVHIEPIGWQRFANLITDELSVIAGNVDEKEYIPLDPFFTRNAALLARTRDYNQNLLGLLETLNESGLIEIREKAFDIFGVNPFNPSTVVAWKKNA